MAAQVVIKTNRRQVRRERPTDHPRGAEGWRKHPSRCRGCFERPRGRYGARWPMARHISQERAGALYNSQVKAWRKLMLVTAAVWIGGAGLGALAFESTGAALALFGLAALLLRFA